MDIIGGERLVVRIEVESLLEKIDGLFEVFGCPHRNGPVVQA